MCKKKEMLSLILYHFPLKIMFNLRNLAWFYNMFLIFINLRNIYSFYPHLNIVITSILDWLVLSYPEFYEFY